MIFSVLEYYTLCSIILRNCLLSFSLVIQIWINNYNTLQYWESKATIKKHDARVRAAQREKEWEPTWTHCEHELLSRERERKLSRKKKCNIYKVKIKRKCVFLLKEQRAIG